MNRRRGKFILIDNARRLPGPFQHIQFMIGEAEFRAFLDDRTTDVDINLG